MDVQKVWCRPWLRVRCSTALSNMQALIYTGKNRLEFRDVAAPTLLAPTDVLVRPLAVARCDLEAAFFRHRLTPLLRAGIAAHWLSPALADAFGSRPFSGPFAVGHECVGEVIECGPSVKTLNTGDVVVVPFQISCGECQHCSRNWTALCTTDRRSAVAAFGGFADPAGQWGGAAADLLRVPYADPQRAPLKPRICDGDPCWSGS